MRIVSGLVIEQPTSAAGGMAQVPTASTPQYSGVVPGLILDDKVAPVGPQPHKKNVEVALDLHDFDDLIWSGDDSKRVFTITDNKLTAVETVTGIDLVNEEYFKDIVHDAVWDEGDFDADGEIEVESIKLVKVTGEEIVVQAYVSYMPDED